MISVANQNRLLKQVTELSEENKRLNLKTKELGEDNQTIAKQNRSFVLCGFQVFAKYTRDVQPIQNLDLEGCTTDSQSKATNNSKVEGTMPDTSSNTSSATQDAVPLPVGEDSASSHNNTTTPQQPQSNNPQPGNDGVTLPVPSIIPLVPDTIHIPSPF